MRTFFQIAVSICMLALTFSLVANFVYSIGAFPYTTSIGTIFEGPNIAVLLGVVLATGGAAVAAAILFRSPVPIGVHLFGTVFWASWINAASILSYGGYLPLELISIVTAGVAFIFAAAIIGMLTGSG